MLDVASATIISVQGLGFKDHSKPYNALDTSDADGGANIVSRPVFGLYQPDEMRSFRCGTVASDLELPVTQCDTRLVVTKLVTFRLTASTCTSHLQMLAGIQTLSVYSCDACALGLTSVSS